MRSERVGIPGTDRRFAAGSALLALTAAIVALPASAQDAMQVLTIDPELGRTIPALPTVNAWGDPSILVRTADPTKDVLLGVESDSSPRDAELSRGSIIINFKRGKQMEVKRQASTGIWTVTTAGRTAIGIRVVSTDVKQRRHVQLYPIQVEWKPWFTEFSAGFSVLGNLGTTKYGLRPEAGSTGQSILTAVGTTTDVSYRASAFVHYVPLQADFLAGSFGVSTDIPVSNLSLMLGLSVRLRTLPVVNDGFLTLGVALTPTKVLRGSVGDVVPAGTDIDSLMETKYGFGLFAAVSFGFLGGEERFKGVYGSAEQGTSAAVQPTPAPVQAAPPG